MIHGHYYTETIHLNKERLFNGRARVICSLYNNRRAILHCRIDSQQSGSSRAGLLLHRIVQHYPIPPPLPHHPRSPPPSLFINISAETIGTVSITDDNVPHNCCAFRTVLVFLADRARVRGGGAHDSRIIVNSGTFVNVW